MSPRYHSLSTNMVPARVERAPMAPDMLVRTTRNMNIGDPLCSSFWSTSSVATASPATMNDRFWVNSQSRRTWRQK